MFLGEQGIDIDESMLQEYVAKYGEEKAIGYLQAISDFTAHMEVILGGGFCRNDVPAKGPAVRKHLGEFVNHNKKFLKAHRSNSDIKLSLY